MIYANFVSAQDTKVNRISLSEDSKGNGSHVVVENCETDLSPSHVFIMHYLNEFNLQDLQKIEQMDFDSPEENIEALMGK